MGIDLEAATGETFHSNWWHWRKMWHLAVAITKELTEEEKQAGNSNDGIRVSAEHSKLMGERLLAVSKDAITFAFYKKQLDDVWLPREEKEVKWYLDRDFLEEFATFALNSEGFEVW